MLGMLAIDVESTTLRTQLPAHQSKFWPQSYPQCNLQWI